MLLQDHFKIGDKVKLGIHLNKHDMTFFETKILDISEDTKELFLYDVNSKNKTINIDEGEIISIVKEQGALVFLFNTILLERNSENLNSIVVRIPSEIERMQRREFYRLPIAVKIALRKTEDKKIALGETLDLSGNGLSVDLDSDLEINDEVILDLPLTEDIHISDVYGKVTRKGKGELLPFRYGIEFNNIEENKRERIVSYIFQIQRMRIKLAKDL